MTVSPMQLLAQYGYLAVFLGSVLEGETILVLAGFAAHQGYLSFSLAAALGFLGGLFGDQVFFFLGRRYGQRLLARFPRLSPHVERVNRLIGRFHSLVIVLVRFLYGLRVAGPVAIGASGLSPWRFLAFNMLGAALWAVAVCGAGYLFGQALTLLFEDAKRYEEVALMGGVAMALGWWLLRRLHRSRG